MTWRAGWICKCGRPNLWFPDKCGACGEAPMRLAEDFGDPETLFNSRDWLQAALEAKGAKVTGGGIGMGGCDLDITLEDCKFNVSMKPCHAEGTEK